MTLTNVHAAQVGSYVVSVSNRVATAQSAPAVLTVLTVTPIPPPASPSPTNFAQDVAETGTILAWDNSLTGASVVNGGFETGVVTPWRVAPSTMGGSFLIQDGTYDPPSSDGPLPPYAGAYCAIGTESGPGTFSLYQGRCDPAGRHVGDVELGAPSAEFLQQLQHVATIPGGGAGHQQCVSGHGVHDGAGGRAAGGAWTTRSYSMAAFAGKTVRVAFVINPGQAHLDAYVDSVSLQTTGGAGAGVTNQVYFGLNPAPGSAELAGTTMGAAWALPALAPLTTYYWQVVAHNADGQAAGPVWRFTTKGVDHFVWSPIASPQLVNQPFGVSVTAQDALNATVSNYTGAVRLSAASAGGATLFSDDFEGADTWTRGTGAGSKAITNGIAASGSHSFTIIGGDSSHYEGVWHTLSNLQPSRVNFSVRTAATNLAAGYFVLASAADGTTTSTADTAVFFYMQPSGVMGLVSSVSSAGFPYAANQWYQVSLLFNWASKTVDYYVNGTLVAAAFPFRAPSVANLSIVHLYNVNNAQSWWDKIEFLSGNSAAPIAVAPTNSGSFNHGVWSGAIAVAAPASNVVCVADDGQGHTGSSAPFAVGVSNDLSLAMTVTPNPVSVGAALTYVLTVANTGPDPSTGVMITNTLPPGVTLVSAVSSQGSCAAAGGLVTGDLGVIAGARTPP